MAKSKPKAASIGQILEQRRKELGLSIEDIQASTKISGRHIVALENDDYGKIPGEAYVRGFIRLYAETVGLEGGPLLAQYKRLSGAYDEPETLAEKRDPLDRDLVKKPRSKWWILALVAAVLLLILGYLGWLGRGTPSPKPPKAKPIATPDKDKSNSTTTPKPPETAPQPTSVSVTLTVVEADCWVEVTTDGKLDYTGTMKVGQVKTWRAQSSIYLFAASGRRLKVLYNNQDLGVIDPAGEPIKKTFTLQGVQDGGTAPAPQQ